MSEERIKERLFNALLSLEKGIERNMEERERHAALVNLLSSENIELKKENKKLREMNELLRLDPSANFVSSSSERLLNDSASYDVDLSITQLKSLLARKN